MSLPKMMGRYIGVITTWMADEISDKPVFKIEFNLTEFLDGDERISVVDDDFVIRHTVFLLKKDGTWSDHAIKSVMESLGWDGQSIKSFVEGNFGGTEVQLTIEKTHNDKDGKDYVNVKFMNPKDYEGSNGLTNDPALVQSLESKYGPMLRAMNKPKLPVKPAATTVDAAKMSAWKEFQAKTPDLTPDQRKSPWLLTVDKYGGKSVKLLTAADWQIIGNKIAEYGPYVESEESAQDLDNPPAISQDDIPF